MGRRRRNRVERLIQSLTQQQAWWERELLAAVFMARGDEHLEVVHRFQPDEFVEPCNTILFEAMVLADVAGVTPSQTRGYLESLRSYCHPRMARYGTTWAKWLASIVAPPPRIVWPADPAAAGAARRYIYRDPLPGSCIGNLVSQVERCRTHRKMIEQTLQLLASIVEPGDWTEVHTTVDQLQGVVRAATQAQQASRRGLPLGT